MESWICSPYATIFNTENLPCLESSRGIWHAQNIVWAIHGDIAAKWTPEPGLIYTYEAFLKWEYPQIIHFHRIFFYKPSIWDIRIYGNLHRQKPSDQRIKRGWLGTFPATFEYQRVFSPRDAPFGGSFLLHYW